MSAATTSEKVAAQLEDLLAITDVGHAVLTIGRRYDTLCKNLARANRPDLIQILKEWKKDDAERLRFALGRQWQEGRGA